MNWTKESQQYKVRPLPIVHAFMVGSHEPALTSGVAQRLYHYSINKCDASNNLFQNIYIYLEHVF